MQTGQDRIEIKDLLLRCIIGLNEAERKTKQDVLLNIVLWTDIRRAAAHDRIDETVNYRSVTKLLLEHVEASHYLLLETLVERLAEICLQDSRVSKVEVSVDKPGALRFARSVGIRIVRENKPGAPAKRSVKGANKARASRRG